MQELLSMFIKVLTTESLVINKLKKMQKVYCKNDIEI